MLFLLEELKLSINFLELTVALAGEPVIFTPMEYRLLKVLVRNSRTVLTRQVLLEKLWNAGENFVDEHALTVQSAASGCWWSSVQPFLWPFCTGSWFYSREQ
mgnify:FL=1